MSRSPINVLSEELFLSPTKARLIAVFIRYGNKFVKRCQSYLSAEEEAADLLISINLNWVKMETQIEIMKKIAPSLSKKLHDMQCHVLSQLEGKLKTATFIIDQLRSEKLGIENAKNGNRKGDDRDITTMLNGVWRMKPLKKMKYVFKKKELYEIVQDIEKWQARYDPTWILIMQMSIGDIDEELYKEQKKPACEQIPIIIAAQGIRAAHFDNAIGRTSIWIDDLDLNPSEIAHSPVQFSSLHDEKDTVLIDTMVGEPMERTAQEVRNLARILREVDPSTFGLLKCRGAIKVKQEKKSSILNPTSLDYLDFKLIFNIPPHHSNPRSLRTLILSGTSYPLDERLDLAKKLTNSILFVHTVQFVHKNIRPETIIVFQNERSCIGAPFLVGFEQFRREDGGTRLRGDDRWQQNLCKTFFHFFVIPLTGSLLDRHPTRQGIDPQARYQMQHDIYSLGVVLLEIGLWTSFVLYDVEKEYSPPVPNYILRPAKSRKIQKILGDASQIKETFEELAAKELPARLGRRYTDIVLFCLRCLDDGTGLDQDGKGVGVNAADWTDEDGFTIGVQYIESVLMKMQEIVI